MKENSGICYCCYLGKVEDTWWVGLGLVRPHWWELWAHHTPSVSTSQSTLWALHTHINHLWSQCSWPRDSKVDLRASHNQLNACLYGETVVTFSTQGHVAYHCWLLFQGGFWFNHWASLAGQDPSFLTLFLPDPEVATLSWWRRSSLWPRQSQNTQDSRSQRARLYVCIMSCLWEGKNQGSPFQRCTIGEGRKSHASQQNMNPQKIKHSKECLSLPSI